jgi:outer membrane protein TolC
MGLPCRALLVVGAFICLSGCAVGPDYDPPAVAVPTTFRATSLTPAIAHAPSIPDFVRWWRVLHDPQLDRLIEMAVAGNPDIEIALTHVQEARSQQIVVLGGMLPTAGGSGMIATGTGIDLSRGRIDPAIAAGDDPRGFRTIDRMAGFDASWEIDLFGKARRSLEAARDDAEARTELRNAMLATVIADVARNYLDIRALQMRQEIARRHIAAAQRTVDEAMARLQSGTSHESESKQASKSSKQAGKPSASDEQDRTSAKPAGQEPNPAKQVTKSALSNESSLGQAKSDLALLQARLPEIAAEISAAQSRLARLLGAYAADVDGAIRGPARLPALPERLHPGVPVELLRRRPDVRAAERELAAATERIGVATACRSHPWR